MGWPPSWGPDHWWFIHSSAKSYDNLDISPEVAEWIKRFFILLCQLLLCPGCRIHCMTYIGKEIPVFKNGAEYWEYTVDFHNAVNKRTNKIEISKEEAEEYLSQRMAEFDLNNKEMHKAFLQNFWNILLYTTYTYTSSPDKASIEEQARLLMFLRSTCFILPFWRAERVQKKLLVFLDNEDNIDLSTRDKALTTITNMHNSVCGEFQILVKTAEEMKKLFMNTIGSPENYSKLVRAHKIREEDHIKMQALQKELLDLKQGDAENNCANIKPWQDATIALGVILGIILLIISMYYIFRYKYHLLKKKAHRKTIETVEPSTIIHKKTVMV